MQKFREHARQLTKKRARPENLQKNANAVCGRLELLADGHQEAPAHARRM
jgi:hypothetical protein